MEHPTWQRSSDLFHRILDAPADDRARILSELDASDPTIAREVRSLVESHGRAGDFLERPVLGDHSDELSMGPGESIRGWRILRELGRGGMSVVYLVERSETDFRQLAAAKLLGPFLHDADTAARFRRERSTLAGLQHPNIARFLDGGQTSRGRPYFVMEFVDGSPIDRFCERDRLPLDARLALCRDACSAVHFAHQRLVIHRDLKPGNVLVARDPNGMPTVKLVDFGISKLIEPTGGDSTGAATRTRWLTPEYASPEQLRGQEVTTSTDVYSLGVLLYRVLTGELPFDVDPADVIALERAICETSPTSLSSRMKRPGSSTSQLLRRATVKDLDCILVRALAKDPSRRYPSADDLGADLERVLTKRPILARKDSWLYRTRRFARRNWPIVSVGAAAALASITGVVGVLVKSREVHAESERVAHVNDYLLGLLSWSDPELDGRGLSYASAVERVATEIDVRFVNDPDLAASLHARVGTTLHRLGSDASARSHLERAREAVSRGRVVAPRVRASVDLALSEIEYDGGDFETAEADAQRALANADDALAIDVRNQIALVWLELDRADEAQGVLEEMVEQLGPTDEDPRRFARILGNLALAEYRNGNLDRARATIERALDLARKSLGDEHPTVARLFEVRSDIAQSSGAYADAFADLEHVLAIREHALGPDHLDVALTLDALARIGGLWLRRHEDARAFLDRASAIVARHRGAPDDTWQIELQNLELRAQLLFADRNVEEAVAILRRVLDGYRARLSDDHEFVLSVRRSLGRGLRDLDCCDEAEAEFEAVMESYTRQGRDARWPCGDVWNELGSVAFTRGDFARALSRYERSIALQRAIYGESTWQVAASRLGRAESLLALDRTSDASDDAEFAYLTLEKTFGEHAVVAMAATAHAACLAAEGEVERAARLFETYVPIVRAERGDRNAWTRRAAARAVHFYRSVGDDGRALPLAALLDSR
jgi:serine/threonine-protein kinase